MAQTQQSEEIASIILELEVLFAAAEAFVAKHYPVTDNKDKGIKILATINQLIELKKMSKGQKG